MRRVINAIVFLAVVSSMPQVLGQPELQSEGKDKPRVNLRIAPGKLIAEGSDRTPLGPYQVQTYKLEEISLPEPIELELRGTKERVESVFRLTITGGGQLAYVGIIWIDDAALYRTWSNGQRVLGAMIYDRSILRDGAEISVTRPDGSQLYALPKRLRLPAEFKATIKEPVEEGNAIVGVHSGLLNFASGSRPVIQIHMKTSRRFPIRNAALEIQIGKQVFHNEVTAGGEGYAVSVHLTPEAFAELKDGAEVIAFYNSPDRSGGFASEIWYFGRLNKSMLDR